MAKASTATGKLVIVTGFKELDAKLRQMPAAMQRKFVRGALRKGGLRLQQEAKRIIRTEAKDTGALEKSVGRPIALKRSRKRVGIAVLPKRDVLFANYAAKHGGKTPHPAKGESEPFYYAAAIEFGTSDEPPVKPFRRALYDNEAVYRAYFKADLTQFIAEQKVDYKLPKISKK
jgi:HK97 gp10 family phage protein